MESAEDSESTETLLTLESPTCKGRTETRAHGGSCSESSRDGRWFLRSSQDRRLLKLPDPSLCLILEVIYAEVNGVWYLYRLWDMCHVGRKFRNQIC